MRHISGVKEKPVGAAILILAFLLPTLWFLHDRITLIQQGEQQKATIIKCEAERKKTMRTGGRPRMITTYHPVAISEKGSRVEGSLGWAGRGFCEKSLNGQVTVFVHPTDSSSSMINTFFQMWFLPTLFGYITTLILILLFFPGRNLSGVVTILVLLTALYGLYLEIYPTKVPAQQNYSADADRSRAVLDNCVAAQMQKKGLQYRSELKYLLCQGSGITDLLSIVDLVNLEELYLQDNALQTLESLGHFSSLHILSVANNKLVSLAGIEHLPNLVELQGNSNKIQHLDGIEVLRELRIIGLMKNQITDISGLQHLQNLQDVVLNYNEITDISALRNKPALKKLQLYANNIQDITPLYSNTNLTLVGIRGRGNVSCDQIQILRSKLSDDAKVWGQAGC